MTSREIEAMLRRIGIPEAEIEGSATRIVNAMGIFRVAMRMKAAREELDFGQGRREIKHEND